MERRRAIPLGLTLLWLAAGVAIPQTQKPRLSPVKEAQSQVQQPVEAISGAAATHPRVAPVLPANQDANQGNAALAPSVQNPAVQNSLAQPQGVQPIVLPPSQRPPSPPRISYVGGKLTVVAGNATLDDVLAGIGKAIGAQIQGAGSQGVDRVFGQFGPASPSQVINTLLVGSRYDFVLVGSPESADSVRAIILSASSGESTQSAQVAPIPSAAPSANLTDSSSLVNNQEPQPPALSPEERAGFRPNHRGPGARAIVRPQSLTPNPTPTPQQTDLPVIPQ